MMLEIKKNENWNTTGFGFKHWSLFNFDWNNAENDSRVGVWNVILQIREVKLFIHPSKQAHLSCSYLNHSKNSIWRIMLIATVSSVYITIEL